MSLSIGRFAKLANVSPRNLRHYESLGLIAASVRGENQYRYYSQDLLARVARIRDLQWLAGINSPSRSTEGTSPEFVQALHASGGQLTGACDAMIHYPDGVHYSGHYMLAF